MLSGSLARPRDTGACKCAGGPRCTDAPLTGLQRVSMVRCRSPGRARAVGRRGRDSRAAQIAGAPLPLRCLPAAGRGAQGANAAVGRGCTLTLGAAAPRQARQVPAPPRRGGGGIDLLQSGACPAVRPPARARRVTSLPRAHRARAPQTPRGAPATTLAGRARYWADLRALIAAIKHRRRSSRCAPPPRHSPPRHVHHTRHMSNTQPTHTASPGVQWVFPGARSHARKYDASRANGARRRARALAPRADPTPYAFLASTQPRTSHPRPAEQPLPALPTPRSTHPKPGLNPARDPAVAAPDFSAWARGRAHPAARAGQAGARRAAPRPRGRRHRPRRVAQASPRSTPLRLRLLQRAAAA